MALKGSRVKNVERHVIELPKRVVVGYGVIRELPRHLLELGLGSPAIVLTGPTATRQWGLEVRSLLMDEGIEVQLLEVKSPTLSEVERILDECGKGYRVVIGVGGGKVLDVAKCVALRLGAKLVSVPTSPSHDGIASPFASIKGFERPTSVRTTMPVLVVADIDVMSKAPRRYVLAGYGDLLGKLTAVLDWRLAHKLRGEYYGEYAASLALLSAKHVIRMYEAFTANKIPKEAIRNLVEALISSGVAMGIAGSTRPASGSEHMFAHALDIVANYPALHGEEVAIGTIMMLYLHGKNWKKLRRIMKRVGLPTTAKELGVSEEKVIEALTKAHLVRPERYTILGEKGLTWEAAERLARVTGVIS